MPSTRKEKENYNCILEILNVAVCNGLREIFKQQWDKTYGTTKGIWDDTCISGNELYNMEKSRSHAKLYLNLYQSGRRSDWDISALVDAILFSNALKTHLAPHISNKVKELRVLRNDLTHKFGSQHKMPDAAFNNAYKKIKNCFKVLKLSTVNIDKIRSSSSGSYNAISLTKITCISSILIALIALFCYLVLNNFETQTLFSVLPTRPVHLVANRSRTVNAILKELHNLSIRNNRALSYLYISGNPGSGKSQLARLVGQRYATNFPVGWFRSSTKVFVMTLNGRSLHDVLESYADFARRLDCDENIIANIINTNKTNSAMKIKSLRTLIAKGLNDPESKYTWLLIFDNVVNLNEISVFYPKDCKDGQVLITTQDVSSVPPNSSLSVHISISRGMDPEESCEFLTDLSGLVENQELVSKVAKVLDYQPLALASAGFYVRQVRESKISPQFTWKEYLKKINEEKRELIETKLTNVNTPAYSLTMSAAVLLAVNMSAERSSVLRHAFTFLSYVSYKTQSLQVVVNYVLLVDKEKDKEDVGLTIQQCCLILNSNNKNIVTISLHRVIHDSIQLYISHGANGNTKLHLPLYIFQSLLEEKCALGEISLIPHLKEFYVRTENLSLAVMMTSSINIKLKQRMQKQIFDLTSVLGRHGEILLSRNYLILALKLAKKKYNKGNVDQKENLHVSFPKIGEIYLNLGVYENLLGNIKQARKYFKKALQILSRQNGPSHNSVSKCLINLASLTCSNSKECDQNLKYSKQALAIDHTLETKAIHYTSLGIKHYYADELEKAREYCIRAYQIFGEILNEPEVDNQRTLMHIALLLSNIGALYHRFGQYENSKKFLTESINIYRNFTGPNHINLAVSYHTLGLTHFELYELQDAEDCYRRALKIYAQHLKPLDRRIVQVSQNLAAVLEETDQKDEAMELDTQYGTCRRQK